MELVSIELFRVYYYIAHLILIHIFKNGCARIGGNVLKTLKLLLSLVLVLSFVTGTSYAMFIDSTGKDRYGTLGSAYINFDANAPDDELVSNMPTEAIKISYKYYHDASDGMTEYYYAWETTPRTPTCENYTFIGWYKEKECINKYPPTSSYSQQESVFPTVIYAGWQCKHLDLITCDPRPATYDEYGIAETYWECSICHQLFSDAAGTKMIDEPKLLPKTSITHYGTDANGMKWELYEYGTLHIKGKGAMKDYTETSAIPWYSQKTSITDIVVDNGITHIGSMSFYGCVQASRIDIAESVTSIGEKAFYRCDDIAIYGFEGSYAEEYAKLNAIRFVNMRPLDDISVDYYHSSKTWYFDITVEDVEENMIAYLCLYDDNNQLMISTFKPCELNDITSFDLPIDADAKTYKIFVWKNMVPKANVYDDAL